jgi:hypothetical protein
VERLTGCNGITDYAEGNLLVDVESHHRIVLADEIITAAVLVRAELEALSAIVRVVGERASRRFIEFFSAARNGNTRFAYARVVKEFFDWCDDPRGTGR